MPSTRSEEWGQILETAHQWLSEVSVWTSDWSDDHPEPSPPCKGFGVWTHDIVRWCDQATNIDSRPVWDLSALIQHTGGARPESRLELDRLAGKCVGIVQRLQNLGVVETTTTTEHQTLPSIITVNIAKGTITIDGDGYSALAHHCTAVQALIEEGGRNLTGPRLCRLHGCAGKKWSREFVKLKKDIPPLNDRIKSDGNKGYRILNF